MKLGLVALCAAAIVFAAPAAGSRLPALAPGGLHAFVYRADEPVKPDHTYALMPAFTWNAVTGASSYELQMATSRAFADATTLYDHSYSTPVASVQKQVPWMTGHPYALWVRVRSTVAGRVSSWSKAFGFNTAWQEVPQQESAPNGLIRWSPVNGATSYDVLYLNVPSNTGLWHVHFPTLTNVADEREYWTFHPAAAKVVQWRVRAVRLVNDPSLPNGIPVVSYGPYSKVFTTPASGTYAPGRIQPIAAVSNVSSPAGHPSPHQLTPGFAWSGQSDVFGDVGSNLWRVYVFSDKQCVNPVLTGSVVGGPAWAPRNSDPLALPGDTTGLDDAAAGKYLGFGAQSGVYEEDATVPAPSESALAAGTPTSPTPPPATGGSTTTVGTPRLVDLPDNGWPQGRYWWTVVPVGIAVIQPPPSSAPPASSSSAQPASDKIEYHDLALPQDVCAAGQVWPFGMQSAPVATTSQTPFASGLVNGTRVVSAASKLPTFQQWPLVTWTPALAADTYEIQLSRRIYPWRAVRSQVSVVPSTVLPLTRHDIGTWYYRVRGVNPNLVGPAQKLSWSKPVAIKISGDRFVVVK